MKRRVVITGLGTVNPIGNNILETWENAIIGKNGIDFIKGFDTENFKTKVAAEIKNLNTEEILGKKACRRLDKFTQYGLIATKEAIDSAKFDKEFYDPYRFGVIVGSGIGGLKTIADQNEKALNKGYNRISPFFIPMSIINLAAGNIAIEVGAKGMCSAPVTACASATNAIGDAFRAIRDNYLDCCITGGSEASVTKFGIGGFEVMNALSKSTDPNNASVPFSITRDGFVMGEGAGILILEELECALKREAPIYGEIIGYGSTCDANHITAPMETGEGALNCMKSAINDANISITDVDYINAHGTSTPLNDKIETKAIKGLFADHTTNIMISSTKSMTGHLLGASGGVEAILTTLMLKNNFILPTINLVNIDPECNLFYTPNKGISKKINIGLSNSFGFGGHNATIVIKKYKKEGFQNDVK